MANRTDNNVSVPQQEASPEDDVSKKDVPSLSELWKATESDRYEARMMAKRALRRLSIFKQC